MQRRVAVIGASGYTGVELTRLLVAHPNVELAVASSDRWVGDTIEARTGAPSSLTYETNQHALQQAADCDIVLLATPADVSLELVATLRMPDVGPKVIDLSGAYRLLDAAHYPAFYKFEHAHPHLLLAAAYGLPELHRAKIREAKLVANPGCYATAIQLALTPLVDRLKGRAHVTAMSGVTGAGRKASEDFSFAEIAGDVRSYRTLAHQHRPEIEQQLGCQVSFVPVLLPVQRGILVTAHVSVDIGAEAIAAAFAARYANEPFITLARNADDVALHHVVGTNRCRIGWTLSERGELVITSTIDNLVKGAAGQAVQNLNLMLGFDERAGLAGLRSFHP